MKIIVAGDFCPQESVASAINDGDIEGLFSDVKDRISLSDYSIVNLEAPIVYDKANPIKKIGPNLRLSSSVLNAINYMNFNCVTLANNHFLDFGEEGAKDTFEALQNAGLDYVGAGPDIFEASKVLYKIVNGKKIGIVNCCEHEYSIATKSTYGSNPLDEVSQFYSIREARDIADYVIVIVHGGIEGYQLPTPRMQKNYRFFIDVGADVVINHHQHCYSGYEIYNGKPIFYGLGNFCFDLSKRFSNLWNEGIMIELSFNDIVSFKVIPYSQARERLGITILEGGAYQDVVKAIEELNAIISDPILLEQSYKRHVDSTSNEIKDALSVYRNKYLKALYNRGALPEILSGEYYLSLHNKIICESHRERMIYYLSSKM